MGGSVFRFTRALSLMSVIALVGGPLCMAPALAISPPVLSAQSTSGATVSGTAVDQAGIPLANVVVTLRGPQTYTGNAGSDGTFKIDNVVPGLYAVTASKPGYGSVSETSLVVAPDASAMKVNPVLAAATLSTIQTIGRTTNAGTLRAGFNTSAATVTTISQQAFQDQSQNGVANILNQIPGVFTEAPNVGGNNADSGSIRFTSIRGSFGNETLALVDGHPVANGQYGDFVSSWTNSFLLQNVEVVEGPGASAPQVINGIGGTVNFRTLDPTRKITGQLEQGFTTEGGSNTNVKFSGTTTNGKFGWVLAYTVRGDNGPLGANTTVPVALPTYALINGVAQKQPPFTTNTTNIPGVGNQPTFNTATAYACCIPVYSNFNDRGALIKGVYHFSDSTVFTGTFLDDEAYADQNGNHLQAFPTLFTPGASFTAAGGQAAGFNGSLYQYNTNTIIDPVYEQDHEPMFNAELRTELGDNTLIARGYSTNISRLQNNPVGSPLATETVPLQLYGTLTTTVGPQTYTGQTALVSLPPGAPYCTASPVPVPCSAAQVGTAAQIGYGSPTYYANAEEDRLRGASFEIDHPLGQNGDLITASYDYNKDSSHSYNYASDPKYTDNSIPLGSYQTFGTLLIRGIFNFGRQFNATLSNYITNYGEHSTNNYGATWNQTSSSRYDPRLGLTFLATPDLSLRASAGGAISYPYLSILDGANSAPASYSAATSTTPAYASNSIGNPGILPETSFGYDLGFDARLPGGQAVISGDIFRTNLFNQFLQATYANGNTGLLCPSSGATLAPAAGGTTCTGPAGATAPYQSVPLYTTQTINLGDARYDGVELGIKADPFIGMGGEINMTLLHAYDYNISPCIYSKVPGCTNPLVNLGVVNGVNFFGTPEGGNASIAGQSFGAVQNHSIPYATGYAEWHYRFTGDGLLSINAQYYGNNNSFNVPAFFVWSATGRIGLDKKGATTAQASVYNLFGAYPNGYATYSGGVMYPLANGQLGLSAANEIGPPVYTFTISHKF